VPGGKGFCCAGTEDATTAGAGAEAVAELHLQLMKHARASVELAAGVTSPPHPAAPGCSYFHLSERLNSCKQRSHETNSSFGVVFFFKHTALHSGPEVSRAEHPFTHGKRAS